MARDQRSFDLLKRYRALVCASLVGLPIWFAYPATVDATLITSGTDTLTSPATWTNQNVRTETIGWTVTFDPAKVTVDWTPATGTYDPTSGGSGALEGRMIITANFPDTSPISILFQQTPVGSANNPNPDPRASGLGLRFTLDSVDNNQGLIPVVDDWTSFAMKLVDPNVQPTFDNKSLDNQGLHPSFPHFHGNGTPNPFNYVSGGDAGNVGMGFVNFGNDGTVGPTGPTITFDTGNIGVHDFEVSGLRRQFTLVLQPNATFTQPPILTSEPPTVLLLVAGLIGLAGPAWRRHRK